MASLLTKFALPTAGAVGTGYLLSTRREKGGLVSFRFSVHTSF
jgi:hypothetical protein